MEDGVVLRGVIFAIWVIGIAMVTLFVVFGLKIYRMESPPKKPRRSGHHPRHRGVGTLNVGVTPAGLAVTAYGNYLFTANSNNYSLTGADSVTVHELRRGRAPTFVATITDPSFDGPYSVTASPGGDSSSADGEGQVFVTNSNGATVTVIDVESLSVSGVIGGFDGPSGLVILPAANTAYVNNYGGPVAGSGNGHTVSVVDLATQTIVAVVDVDQAPAALAASPDGAYVYVVCYVTGLQGGGTMNVIDTSTNTVVATVDGFFGPFAIAVTADAAFISNFGSNNFSPFGTTVSVVDLTTLAITTAIDVGIQPSGVAVAPDGRVVISNYNTLYAGAGFTQLTAGQGTVNFIDPRKLAVVGPTVGVGSSPAAVAIDPAGKFAYVACFSSNTVSVVPL